MPSKLLTVVLVAICAGLLQRPSSGQEESAPKTDNRAASIADRLKEEVARTRGLTFDRPFKIGVYTRTELQKVVTELMAEEFAKTEMKKQYGAFGLLGFFPTDLDPVATVNELLASQIAGFYDPSRKELFLIEEDSSDKQEMNQIMGMSGDIVIAHELTHALQDQHFDLMGIMESEKNLDVAQARHTIVEGDATVLMTLIEGSDPMIAMAYRMAPSSLAGMKPLIAMAQGMGGAAAKEAELLTKTPAVFLDPMLFDYHEGYRFVRKLVEKAEDGSWDFSRVDETLRRPPLSTEQILHPKKFLGDEPDWPTRLDLPDISRHLPKGYARDYGNTLGEMLIRTLLGHHRVGRVKRRHSGWDGDRFEVYRAPQGDPVLVWMSVWDSDKDAVEFAEGLEKVLEKKHAKLEFKPRSEHLISAQTGKKSHALFRHGNLVISVEGGPTAALDAILEELLTQSRQAEMKPLLSPIGLDRKKAALGR